MPKSLSLRRGISSVLFWSIVSAAFIGPGTVTTAARAGADFGLQLLWTLLFSTLATIVLQEAAARVTIASGKNLGQIIAFKYQATNRGVHWTLFGAIAIGCAAYQAGNLLGALSGLALISSIPSTIFVGLLGIICFSVLWIGNIKIIARLLGGVVALMGIAFVFVAVQTDVSIAELTSIPTIPEGSALLVIGLIGTTIVPYNLFLASGISKGQSVLEMRLGIGLAVLIGGLISIAIMVVGTSVPGNFSFENLALALGAKLGTGASIFFGLGLFAAGLSSSVTAPLAAAVTGQSLLQRENADNWSERSRNFRWVWGGVLGTGLLFGLLDVQPIPIIILAQAVNGILLPLVATFLLLTINDLKLFPETYRNGLISNVLLLIIVGVTYFLGLYNVLKAVNRLIPSFTPGEVTAFVLASTVVIVVALAVRIFGKR